MTPESPTPDPDHAPTRAGRSHRLAVAILAITIVAYAGLTALQSRSSLRDSKDFLDMMLQTRSASAGRGPYSAEFVREAYEGFYREEGQSNAIPTGGFYYPPQAMLVLVPFSWIRWPASAVAWQVFLTAMAASCGLLAWSFGRPAGTHALSGALVLSLLLLNPLTIGVIGVGQGALILCGGVSVGQWLYERGHRWAGAIAWGMAGFKPHLGLPLLAAAGLIGGWRRLVEVGIVVAALNLAGCLLTTGTPATLASYLGHLRASHLDVTYNSVANDQIVSWNRLVFVLGGPRVELNAATMILGMLAWGAIFLARGRLARGRKSWTSSEILAGAAFASLFCMQAKGYDLVLLVLLAPWVLQLVDRGRVVEPLVLLGLILSTTVPRSVVQAIIGRAGLAGVSEIALSHRAFAVAALGIWLLGRGPTGRADSHSNQESTF